MYINIETSLLLIYEAPPKKCSIYTVPTRMPLPEIGYPYVIGLRQNKRFHLKSASLI